MKSIIFMLCVAMFTGPAFAGEEDWLLGNWVMTYDPDGDSEDKLTFLKGGEFITTEASSGKKINGEYFVNTDHVKVSLVYKGKIFMRLNLTFDASRDKLYYYSKQTGNTAYYTKRE